jgi:hypothetical protein
MRTVVTRSGGFISSTPVSHRPVEPSASDSLVQARDDSDEARKALMPAGAQRDSGWHRREHERSANRAIGVAIVAGGLAFSASLYPLPDKSPILDLHPGRALTCTPETRSPSECGLSSLPSAVLQFQALMGFEALTKLKLLFSRFPEASGGAGGSSLALPVDVFVAALLSLLNGPADLEKLIEFLNHEFPDLPADALLDLVRTHRVPDLAKSLVDFLKPKLGDSSGHGVLNFLTDVVQSPGFQRTPAGPPTEAQVSPFAAASVGASTEAPVPALAAVPVAASTAPPVPALAAVPVAASTEPSAFAPTEAPVAASTAPSAFAPTEAPVVASTEAPVPAPTEAPVHASDLTNVRVREPDPPKLDAQTTEGGSVGGSSGGSDGSTTGGSDGSTTGRSDGSTTGGSDGSTTGGSDGSTTGGSDGSTTGGSDGSPS